MEALEGLNVKILTGSPQVLTRYRDGRLESDQMEFCSAFLTDSTQFKFDNTYF